MATNEGKLKMKLKWMRSLLCILCLLSSMTTLAAKLDTWMEFTSDHFVVYSDRSPKEAEALLNDFERFRFAALSLTGLQETTEDQRTQIYLFKNKQDYQLVQPDPEIAGFYRDTWQGARMVVGAEAGLRDVSLVLFHEYAHHIMRSRSNIRYPLWYDEGFADVLASAQIDSKHVVFGEVNPWREESMLRAGLLSVQELLQPPIGKSDVFWSKYYASSWMFVHYLQLGYLSDNQNRIDALRRYIVAVHQGADPITEFQLQFHLSPSDMDKELKRYVDRRFWKGYRIDVPEYQGKMRARTLVANEAAFLLGDLAYRSGQTAAALQILQYIDASEVSVAPALALRAVLENHQHHVGVARHFMALALRMAPSNSHVATSAAHFNWDLVALRRVTSSTQEHQDVLQKVQRYAEYALTLDPENIEAGRYLARALGATGQTDKAIAVLEAAHQRRPTDLRLNFELGSMLATTTQANQARPYLKNILAWDHSYSRKQAAQKLLRQLDDSKKVLLTELESSFERDN